MTYRLYEHCKNGFGTDGTLVAVDDQDIYENKILKDGVWKPVDHGDTYSWKQADVQEFLAEGCWRSVVLPVPGDRIHCTKTFPEHYVSVVRDTGDLFHITMDGACAKVLTVVLGQRFQRDEKFSTYGVYRNLGLVAFGGRGHFTVPLDIVSPQWEISGSIPKHWGYRNEKQVCSRAFYVDDHQPNRIALIVDSCSARLIACLASLRVDRAQPCTRQLYDQLKNVVYNDDTDLITMDTRTLGIPQWSINKKYAGHDMWKS